MQVDTARVKKLGPDRVATEWLLRNGACVKYVGGQQLFCDYNALPSDEIKFTGRIKEIVGKDSGINSLGFEHLRGLGSVDRVCLEHCKNVEDDAISKLEHVKDTLLDLEIIGCKNITDTGLLYAKKLTKLQKLRAENLPYVKDAKAVEQELKRHLPNCQISVKA